MDLAHHPGKHVAVDLAGFPVGGVACPAGTTATGKIVGNSALGQYLTIELDAPVNGHDMISVEPGRVTARDDAEVFGGGIPQEIVDLVRKGKMKKAIAKYRELNGASLGEAQAALQQIASD